MNIFNRTQVSSKFINYTTDINSSYIQSWWDGIGRNYTNNELNDFAQYPESFSCTPTSTGEDLFGIEEKESITVFPNPVGSIVNFKCNEFENSNVKVAIFDIKGQIVFEDYISYSLKDNHSIFVEHLPIGLYTINLWNDNTFESKKFIKY